MDPLLIAAASGMKARLESLDLIANNVANTSTPGFKADRDFSNVYADELPVVEGRRTDFSQGALVEDGNPLSLALSGKGFFAVNGPNGIAYTRTGTFQISKANELVTRDGYTLRDARNQGKPIQVDPSKAIVIDKAGVVSQGGQEIGQVEIVQMPSTPDVLTKLGYTYFSMANAAAGDAASQPPEVLQGFIEQSNVNPAESAIRVVGVLRQFEMLQRAIAIGAQMNKESTQDVARVNQ
jgi:flagellar basal-body rod protein FlgF